MQSIKNYFKRETARAAWKQDLEETINHAKMYAAPLVVAAGLTLSPTPSSAEETPNKVFAGTLVTEDKGVDTLVKYDHDNGASVHAESTNNVWTEETSHAFNLGLRGPKFLNDLFRISGALDFNEDFEDWGHSAFLEAFPAKGLTLRAGAIQNSEEVLGGFLSGKYSHENFTIDADGWHDGEDFNGRGFAAGVIPFGKAGDLYLSVGGDISRDVIHTLTGWMNPGGFGVFNRVSFDVENESQSGQILLADQSTYTKGKFDFKQHVYNGTEMRYTTTGLILDGWAPFPAFYTNNLELRVDWHNSDDSAGASAMVYCHPVPGIFLGLGAGDSFDKLVEEHAPLARAELYAKIVGPLEAWADLPIDLKTGEMTPTLYVGVSGTF